MTRPYPGPFPGPFGLPGVVEIAVLTLVEDGLEEASPFYTFSSTAAGTLRVDFHTSVTPPAAGAGDIATTTQSISSGNTVFTWDLSAYPGETGYLHFRVGASNILTSQQISTSFTPASIFTGQEGGYYDASVLTSLWQDSARTTQVAADGDPVGCWDDLSGNGNHLTQSNNTLRPVYRTSGGLHWVENGASTKQLNYPVSAASWASGTAIVAWRSENDYNGGSPLANWGTSGSNSHLAFSNTCYLDFGSSTRPSFGALTINVLTVVTAVAASGSLKLYLDKVQNGSTATVTNAFATAPKIFTTGVGDGTQRIYSLIVTEGTLSAPNLANCETWCGETQGRSI